MTTLLSLTMLDVGHGTSMVLQSAEEVIIIDAGRRATLLEYLVHAGINEVAHFIVSHADFDHLDGLTHLMLNTEFAIRNVYVNPDATKDTDSWIEFRSSFRGRREAGATPNVQHLKSDTPIPVSTPNLSIEVLAPALEDWLGGVGGFSLDKRKRMDSNALSAVIRVTYGDINLLLAGGDAGKMTFDALDAAKRPISAEVLAFPHHGGRPGGANDMVAFGEMVTRMVAPKWVVFSIGRGRHHTPQPDIVRGVRRASSEARVACTQLSERCAGQLLKPSLVAHLRNIPAMGRATGACCAGSMVWVVDEGGVGVSPRHDDHDAFITAAAESPLCRI